MKPELIPQYGITSVIEYSAAKHSFDMEAAVCFKRKKRNTTFGKCSILIKLDYFPITVSFFASTKPAAAREKK